MPTFARGHQLKNGILYHIYNRANRKYEIFHENEDYESFKKILLGYVKHKVIRVLHYVLIPNHYHLEAEVVNPEEISSIVGGINRSYTHYYHKKYGTAGYLWQGRFRSKPIQSELYSIYCGGYIEMNPVRANLVKIPEEYAHSSARYYILGKEDPLVTKDPYFNGFGVTEEERQQKYSTYLMENFKEKQKIFNKEIIGSGNFKRKLQKRLGRWVPRRKGRPIFVS